MDEASVTSAVAAIALADGVGEDVPLGS